MKRALVPILGSNALSQLLIVATTPLLTRLYTQAEFGAFGVATTLALVLSTLLTLRLEHSIHASRLGAGRVYRASLSLVLLMTLSVLVPALLLVLLFAPVEPLNALAVAGFALGHALTVIGLIFCNYRQQFRTFALLSLLIPGVFLAGALLCARLGGPANGLLISQASAYALAAGIALYLHRNELKPLSRAALGRVLDVERGNWQFLVPSQLLSISSLNLAVVGAAALYDARMAGLILIAQRIARAPVTVIGNGLNEVLRAAIPERQRLKRTFNRIALLCVLCAAAVALVVYAIPESAYALILGDGWAGLKPVLLITVIGAGCQLIGTSVVSMLTAFDKRADLEVNSALAASGALTLLAAWLAELDALSWLWLNVIATGAVYLTGFLLAHRIAMRESAVWRVVR